MYIYMYVYTYVCVCVYTRTHTHTSSLVRERCIARYWCGSSASTCTLCICTQTQTQDTDTDTHLFVGEGTIHRAVVDAVAVRSLALLGIVKLHTFPNRKVRSIYVIELIHTSINNRTSIYNSRVRFMYVCTHQNSHIHTYTNTCVCIYVCVCVDAVALRYLALFELVKLHKLSCMKVRYVYICTRKNYTHTFMHVHKKYVYVCVLVVAVRGLALFGIVKLHAFLHSRLRYLYLYTPKYTHTFVYIHKTHVYLYVRVLMQ